jgi:uncharacterized protein (DUF427 family)
MKATWKGTVLAESDDTVVVEGNHYFPAAALHREHFRDSATHTVCPWKGTASYYDVVVGADVNRDAAWYYPAPKPAAANITGRVAFWKGVQVAALALFLLLGACPAAALEDLTGTWEGTLACESIDDGFRGQVSGPVTLEIDDGGSGGIGLVLPTVGNMLGSYVVDNEHPERAVLQVTTCELTPIQAASAVMHGEFKTKPGSVKATFTGTLIVLDGPGESTSLCELKLKRIDTSSVTPICLL